MTVNLLELPPVLALRRSFRWKLLATLLGSVALLAAVTLIVVRSETSRQIELASQQAEQRSRDAFIELEEHNHAQISQRSTVFTGSVQAAAALEAALEGGDTETLLADVNYEFEARRIPHSLVAFTDAYGEPVLAMLDRAPLAGEDPADVTAAAERVLEAPGEVRGYRVVQDELYSVETLLLDLGRPIGTVTIGVPITDDDAARLGSVIGADVCFVVDGGCVAGTVRARDELRSAMVRLAGAERSQVGTAAGARWRLVSDRLMAGDDRVWRVIAVPLDPVIAPFERVQNALLIGGLGALLLAALVSLLLANSLTRPVQSLVSATSRVGAGDYSARADVHSIDEIGALGRAFNDMAEGLALKERYRGVLDKVVSRDIAEELLKGDVALGGETREVTTVFADIAGFTGMTDGMRPTEVIALLNECMQRLTDAVEAEGGVVDKYIGDEIMALFGAPVSRAEDPLRAVRAALGMQRAMVGLNEARSLRGERTIEVSIGMNTGAVMAGNMGSSNRLNYTVLGDAVNMAARVEQLARAGQIVMTEHTLSHVRAHVDVRDLGATELRGFSQPVRLYELLGMRADAPVPETRQQRETRESFAGTAGGPAGVLLAALLAAVAATPAAGQPAGDLPTLERFHVSSASGWFQLGFSGRLDVEGYLPQDGPAWIIPDTDPFVAPRLRVFGDAFFGEHLVLSSELRVDRGEEPRAGAMEVRLDQLFVRLTPSAPVALQAGRFVTPFGGYPQRHHTAADPLIRPPLPYDYRTVLNAARAPASATELLRWKDAPAMWRPTGAPVIWGAPYQWGAMLMGDIGPVTLRGAAMNSAPSSEPEEWGLDRGFGAPSWIAAAAMQVATPLRLELAYNRGPWMRADDDHDQVIWAAGAVFQRGGSTVRAEAFHDSWGVPNVGYDVVDVSWYVEAEHDVASITGLTLAARYGAIHFLDIGRSASYDSSGDDVRGTWDYDVARIQLGGGYRIARNAGVRAEYALNRSAAPADPRDDLLSLQLWWDF